MLCEAPSTHPGALLAESNDPEFDDYSRRFGSLETAAEKLLKDTKAFTDAAALDAALRKTSATKLITKVSRTFFASQAPRLGGLWCVKLARAVPVIVDDLCLFRGGTKANDYNHETTIPVKGEDRSSNMLLRRFGRHTLMTGREVSYNAIDS